LRLGMGFHVTFAMPWTRLLDMASRAGVSVVEFKFDDIRILTRPAPLGLRRILEGYNFEIGVHAPYIDINPASLNPLMRMASQRSLMASVRFAAGIGARYIVCHVGRLSRDYPLGLRARAFTNLVRTLGAVAREASRFGIELTVENDHKTDDYSFSATPDALRRVAERLGCKVTLDLGHANTVGNPVEYIDQLKDLISVVHIHDNRGALDEHLPLGRGTLDVRGCIRALNRINFNGPLVVEVHSIPGTMASIRMLNRLLSRAGATPR